VKGERRDSEKARVVRCGRLLLEETRPWWHARQFGGMFPEPGLADLLAGWQRIFQQQPSAHYCAVLYCTYCAQAPKYRQHWTFPTWPFPGALSLSGAAMIHPQADQVELSQPSPGETTSYEVALLGRGKAHDAPPMRATGEQESCMRVNLAGQWPHARSKWKAMECRRGTSEDC
jgi:hypothetical protein